MREMNMAGIKLFQILKTRVGEPEAEALINFVDTSLKDNNKEIYEMNLRTFATKEELAKVEGRLETKIAEVKSDVIRWTFAFFVTMMLAILGLYLKK
jgi:hypothetical protein